jgi:hypothetical protein
MKQAVDHVQCSSLILLQCLVLSNESELHVDGTMELIHLGEDIIKMNDE